MIGELARRIGFWTLDFLRGSNIRKHYRDIKHIMNQEKNYKKLADKHLENLLDHAVSTSEYYRDYKGYDKLQDFPIVDKNIIKDNQNQIISKNYKGKDLHSMSTSGSTGTPFTVYQNINKRKRTIADLIYFNNIAGQKLGDRFMYIKAFSEPKTKIESLKQNVIAIDILKLNNDVLEEIRETLKKDKSINSILAYASSYEQLGNYLQKMGDTPEMFKLKALFSSSTLLTDDTKNKLLEVFGCPIIDRYSNQENGVLAQTRDTFGEFHINRASYYIELLKIDSDEVAEKGELGRVIITDLYNFAMPMIRYDTGDLAISDDNRENLNTLRNIQGRRVDIIYDTKGNMLTPHTWSVHMRKYKELKQWQFIQNDKNKYILKVNGAKGIYTKEDFNNTLRSILGSDAEIEIQYVDKIPVLDSGKFKNTICNYKPNY